MEEMRKESYAKAGAVASEALGSIRTINSFSWEVAMTQRYTSNLGEARKHAIVLATKAGSGGALMMAIMFAMYGGGFWYGGTLIADSRMAALKAHPPPTQDYGVAMPVDTNSTWFLQSKIAAEACGRYSDNEDALRSCACSIEWPTDPQEIADGNGGTFKVTYTPPNCGCMWACWSIFRGKCFAQRMCLNWRRLTAFFAVITGAFSLVNWPSIRHLVKHGRWQGICMRLLTVCQILIQMV